MSDDDDDLRFGDISGGSGDGSDYNLEPAVVAIVVIVILVVAQPLSGGMGGISMNWIAVLVVAAGGFLGAVS